MDFAEKKAAVIDAFDDLDPHRMRGAYLKQVADIVAPQDSEFMFRQELIDKACRFLGIQRKTSLGSRYLPKLHPVAAALESDEVLVSYWDPLEPSDDSLRHRVYRRVNRQ